MMYKTYIITIFCQTTKKNNIKEHSKGVLLFYWFMKFRVSVNVKNTNRFLINFILEFMKFDVVLCYNKIDYVMEVGDGLSHF